MNEYSILMHLLTKKGIKKENGMNYIIMGIKDNDICKNLKYSGKLKKIRLNKILNEFSEAIEPFGLYVKKNPFNNYWYLSQSQEIQEFFNSNPFFNKKRLGATLSVILSLCLAHHGNVDISLVKKFRKKNDISKDLEDLVKLNFIILEENNVKINPYLGYFIDIEHFIEIIEKKIQVSDLNRKSEEKNEEKNEETKKNSS